MANDKTVRSSDTHGCRQASAGRRPVQEFQTVLQLPVELGVEADTVVVRRRFEAANDQVVARLLVEAQSANVLHHYADTRRQRGAERLGQEHLLHLAHFALRGEQKVVRRTC